MTTNPPQELPDYLVDWDANRLTAQSRYWARTRILDVLGCILAGADTEAAAIVRAFVKREGSAGRAAIFGTIDRSSASLAALANGTAAHATDFDDMAYTMFAHPSAFLVPAILAIAEEEGASGEDVVSSYVFGFEVASYFGSMMNPNHYNSGWHSTATIGTLGSAAAAAKLYRLTEAELRMCLGIAASSAAGIRRNFGSMTKALHAGQAAQRGLVAASLAREGFTSRLNVFAGDDGFLTLYGGHATPDPTAKCGLFIEAEGSGIKPYPCCGSGITTVDLALDLRVLHALQADDIVTVRCAINPLTAKIMTFGTAANGEEAKYCPRYCTAVALLDGRAGLAQFEDKRVRGADVQDFMKRVTIEVDERLIGTGNRIDVQIEVTLSGGKVVRGEASVPRGSTSRPLTDGELRDKFMACAGNAVGTEKASEVMRLVRGLDGLSNLSAFFDALRPDDGCGEPLPS